MQVQSWQQASNNTGIFNTCTWLWLTESEQATLVDSIKDVVRSSVKVPKFDKLLKKAGGYIGRNVVEMTIKTKTIVRKPLMIKITIHCHDDFVRDRKQSHAYDKMIILLWFINVYDHYTIKVMG